MQYPKSFGANHACDHYGGPVALEGMHRGILITPHTERKELAVLTRCTHVSSDHLDRRILGVPLPCVPRAGGFTSAHAADQGNQRAENHRWKS